MNKQHPCCYCFFEHQDPSGGSEVPMWLPKGVCCGYLRETSFISASRYVFLGYTVFRHPPNQGSPWGYTRAQNVLGLKKEVETKQTTNIQSSICRGYPQVPAGGI